jgi:ribosome-binding factor A
MRKRGSARAGGPTQRQLRVGEELRHALVAVIGRGGFRDPALDGVQVTVTEVRVSPDLKNATAFVVPFAKGGDPAALAKALGHAASYLRREIAEVTRLRYVPRLRFEPDLSFDRAAEIDRLLRRPDVARDLATDATPAEDEHGA